MGKWENPHFLWGKSKIPWISIVLSTYQGLNNVKHQTWPLFWYMKTIPVIPTLVHGLPQALTNWQVFHAQGLPRRELWWYQKDVLLDFGSGQRAKCVNWHESCVGSFNWHESCAGSQDPIFEATNSCGATVLPARREMGPCLPWAKPKWWCSTIHQQRCRHEVNQRSTVQLRTLTNSKKTAGRIHCWSLHHKIMRNKIHTTIRAQDSFVYDFFRWLSCSHVATIIVYTDRPRNHLFTNSWSHVGFRTPKPAQKQI